MTNDMKRLMEAINALAIVEDSCGTDVAEAEFNAVRTALYAQLGSLYFDALEAKGELVSIFRDK